MQPGHRRNVHLLSVERHHEGDARSRYKTCLLKRNIGPRMGEGKAECLGKVVPQLDGFEGLALEIDLAFDSF